METGEQGAENTVTIHENTEVIIQENTVIIQENICSFHTGEYMRTVVVIKEKTLIIQRAQLYYRRICTVVIIQEIKLLIWWNIVFAIQENRVVIQRTQWCCRSIQW